MPYVAQGRHHQGLRFAASAVAPRHRSPPTPRIARYAYTWPCSQSSVPPTLGIPRAFPCGRIRHRLGRIRLLQALKGWRTGACRPSPVPSPRVLPRRTRFCSPSSRGDSYLALSARQRPPPRPSSPPPPRSTNLLTPLRVLRSYNRALMITTLHK